MLGFLRSKHLPQSGDTIVEVMLAIAIIGSVIISAFVTTNKNLQSTQDSQERGQAVQLVQAQIESIHANNGLTASFNCFDSAGMPKSNGPVNNNPCVVKSDGAMNTTGAQPSYTLKVVSSGLPLTYTITASWESIKGTGTNNVTMYYRLD